MKRTMFSFLILLSLLFACELSDEVEQPLITCDYAGEFYLFIYNNTTHALFVTSQKELYEYEVKEKTGDLGSMDIKAVKVTGEAYPDKGDLVLTLWDGNNILVTDTAVIYDKEAQIFYDF